MYLVEIDYRNDVERKKVDYVISKYKDLLDIRKPRGMVLIVDAPEDDLRRFIEEVYTRIDPERVKVYAIAPTVKASPEPRRITLALKTSVPPEAAKLAISGILSRIGGVLLSERGNILKYSIKRRGVNMEVNVLNLNRDIIFDIMGYGEAFDKIVSKLIFELNSFKLGEVRPSE